METRCAVARSLLRDHAAGHPKFDGLDFEWNTLRSNLPHWRDRYRELWRTDGRAAANYLQRDVFPRLQIVIDRTANLLCLQGVSKDTLRGYLLLWQDIHS